MKQLTLALLLLQNFFAFSQSTVLQPGDIALVGFNFKNPDEFSFISFAELAPGTVIYFTDSGWKSDLSFREGEGVITYTVPSDGKKAMEVITYPQDAGFTTIGINGFFGFSTEGDQLFIFQGSFDNPAFLFGMDSSDNPWAGDATDNNTSALPAELISSGMSIQFHQVINAMYDCNLETSSDIPHLLQSVITVSNWNTSPNRFLMPSSCFDNALDITLIDFKIYSSVHGAYAVFELLSDEESNIYLEESEDGVNFYAIDSLTVFAGKQRYSFTSHLFKSYYRLQIRGKSGDFYSQILNVHNRNEEPEEVIWYSVQGVPIQVQQGSIIAEELSVKNPGVYLMKKVYKDGSFVVEKVIIDR